MKNKFRKSGMDLIYISENLFTSKYKYRTESTAINILEVFQIINSFGENMHQ